MEEKKQLVRTAYISFRVTNWEKAILKKKSEKCGLSVSNFCRDAALGAVLRTRYTEEEKELFRDVSQVKGVLQRLNNYFGARQYKEVFEENRRIIKYLKSVLKK